MNTTPSKTTKKSFTLNFNHIALLVKDVDRSVEFYQRVFNLKEIKNLTGKEGIRWLSLDDGGEIHLISLYDQEIKLHKSIHFCMATPDFDSFIKNLEDQDIPYTDWPGNVNQINFRADGIKQIYIQDPDGYWVEVNNVGE